MTYEQIEEMISAENDRMDQAIAETAYREGSTDAGVGQPPRYADEAYLLGYMATIQLLPKDALSGRIQYRRIIGDSPDPDFYPRIDEF